MSAPTFDIDPGHAEAILERYDTAGPRYTSYPTAPVWTESYGVADYRRELAHQDVTSSDALALYVHIPFCQTLCHFCACNRVITKDVSRAAEYLEVLAREVEAVRESVSAPRLATQLHWGGGTPTYLNPEQIRRLYTLLTDAFPMREGAEISIEVDPRRTTAQHIEVLRECGFNRISMGVQDFDPTVQEAVHRIQPAEMTRDLTRLARDAGFESVNYDLIYGLPFQREGTFERTLDTVIDLAPDRLALYSYAHVTWKARQQRGFESKDLPDAHTKLRLMLRAIRRFLDAGYVYIGLDHFARPDDELTHALQERTLRRNFMGHTTQDGVELIGFGASAISELRGSYAQSQRDVGPWQVAVRANGLATMRGHWLTPDDVRRRWIISRLICLSELRADEYRAEFGEKFSEKYATELRSLACAEQDGLLEISSDGSLCVTSIGRLLVRNIAMAFDAYLSAQQRSGEQIFSKTV